MTISENRLLFSWVTIIKPNSLLPQVYILLILISTLRNIKSNIIADFVRTNQHNIIIMMNKIIFTTDLQTIENYIKNTDHLDSEDIETSCLPQSKFYLKIISIPYFIY